MEKSFIAILIPALNESTTIHDVVQSVMRFGIPIVIDDGSVDNTQEIALQAGAITFKHEKNLGYDSALNSGFKIASEMNFKYCVTFDADAQHHAENIKDLIEKLYSEKAAITVGTRPIKQRLAEYIFSFVTNRKYGIKDPLCGLKAYDISLYHKLGHFDSYKSIGTELLLYALRKEYRVSQIKIKLNPRHDNSRFSSLVRGNLSIFRSLIIGYCRYMQ